MMLFCRGSIQNGTLYKVLPCNLKWQHQNNLFCVFRESRAHSALIQATTPTSAYGELSETMESTPDNREATPIHPPNSLPIHSPNAERITPDRYTPTLPSPTPTTSNTPSLASSTPKIRAHTPSRPSSCLNQAIGQSSSGHGPAIIKKLPKTDAKATNDDQSSGQNGNMPSFLHDFQFSRPASRSRSAIGSVSSGSARGSPVPLRPSSSMAQISEALIPLIE